MTDIMRALFDEDVIREMHENSIRRESREEGWKEGREEGWEEGRKEGWEEGEESMAEMNRYLVRQKRYEDLERASDDPAFRQQIYEEMAARAAAQSTQD